MSRFLAYNRARKSAFFNHGIPTARWRGEARDVADYHHPPLMIMRPSPSRSRCSKNRRRSCCVVCFHPGVIAKRDKRPQLLSLGLDRFLSGSWPVKPPPEVNKPRVSAGFRGNITLNPLFRAFLFKLTNKQNCWIFKFVLLAFQLVKRKQTNKQKKPRVSNGCLGV